MKNLKTLLSFILILVAASSLQYAQVEFKTLRQAADLPENITEAWEVGDLFASFGDYKVVFGGSVRTSLSYTNYPVGNTKGCIVSFVPARSGVQSDVCLGSPYLRLKDRLEYLSYSSVTPLDQPVRNRRAIQATGSFAGAGGEKARVRTLYRFFPEQGKIDITSTLTNSGSIPLERFRYSLYANAKTGYNFSPFHRDHHPDLNFRVYLKPGHALVWMNMNPVLKPDEKPKTTLAPGETFSVHYTLRVDTDPNRLVERMYSALEVETERLKIELQDFAGDEGEVIIREIPSGALFYRNFFSSTTALEAVLPAGTYHVRAHLFPGSSEGFAAVRSAAENAITLPAPLLGTVTARISDPKGNFVPGKVTFIGLEPTSSPYFQPVNPLKSGRSWEGFKNSCFPGEQGVEAKLPVGTYMVYASRGPEYDYDQKIVEILAQDNKALEFMIAKTVDTSGLISVDPHLHTQKSDGNMLTPQRLRSCIAEGLDVAVSSEHNYIEDFHTVLSEEDLDRYLAVIYGNEITVSGMIHYNSYPLKFRPEEEDNGAIDPVAPNVTPLFERSRAKDPDALIQVNHPRSGTIGYFNQYKLDPEAAAFALEGFDLAFDVLEIVNGPYYHSSNAESIRDWFHLLNRGYYFPLVGSSDSHGIDRSEPGYSRTYVLYEGEKGPGLDQAALFSAMKKGRSFASNGPIVAVHVNNSYTFGDTCTDTDGQTSVKVRVQRAPWIHLNEVRLIINGKRRMGYPIQGEKAESRDLTFTLDVPLEKDASLVVEVMGKSGLYPVMQRPTSGLVESAILAYALTNPIFIDVDGNGRFDPPLSEKIRLLPTIPDPEKAAPLKK
jgi:hypothetical protein